MTSHSAQYYSQFNSYSALNNNFFDAFIFDTIDDPTNGYVDYVDRATATEKGYAKYVNGKVYVGVDSENVASGRGRQSVRLRSNFVFNGNNLVVVDLDHMPSTAGKVLRKGCSLWPGTHHFILSIMKNSSRNL